MAQHIFLLIVTTILMTLLLLATSAPVALTATGDSGSHQVRVRRQLDTLGGGHVPYGHHNPKHGSNKAGGTRRRKERHEFVLPTDKETAATSFDSGNGGSPYTQYLSELVHSSDTDGQPLATLSRHRRHKVDHHDDVSLLPTRKGVDKKVEGEQAQHKPGRKRAAKREARRWRRQQNRLRRLAGRAKVKAGRTSGGRISLA